MQKIECVKDVIMNGTGEVEFTKGNMYEAHVRSTFPIEPLEKVLVARNNSGCRHRIKMPDNPSLDEFFNEHFKVVATEVPK